MTVNGGTKSLEAVQWACWGAAALRAIKIALPFRVRQRQRLDAESSHFAIRPELDTEMSNS